MSEAHVIRREKPVKNHNSLWFYFVKPDVDISILYNTPVLESHWINMGTYLTLLAGVILVSAVYVTGETYPKYNITVVSAKCADSGLIPCDVDNVQCFHNKSRCNSVPDCDNGRDESPEFCECRGNQFRCNITHCINILSRCDGSRDCADGRDEENCESYHCLPTQFKCLSQHMCVPRDKHCDYVNDCGDNSDEQNCTMPTCDYSQFKCNSGQCVEAAKLCDGQFNCKDHSDEDPNICALHYRCQSGFYRLSKHRCNGFTDCPVSEDDEINCGKPCDASQMMCRSGRCINETNVCDFHCDCQYCEDEEGCDQTYCDLSSHFICLKANRCLHSRYICDGVDNCMDKDIGSDENFCSANITECFTALRKSGYSFPMSQMFHCKDGRCMLTRHQCNTVQECFGGDDELNCTFPACAPDEFRCGGGDCVKRHQVCNNQRDCKDWSDEKDCSQKICSADQKQCKSGHCIPSHYWCDRFPDCRDGSDERDCQYRKCLPDELTCANGQCVPLRMFCYNGTAGQNRGCRDGSNLLNCSQHTCQDPQNQFKCHRSYCIDKTQVCNNVWDCVFNYYDEQECNYICPAGSNLCICHNQEMFCDHRNLTQLPLPISKEQINKLNYQGNKLGYNLRTDSLSKGGTNMDKVIYVDLSNNLITDIPAYMFQYMYSVKTLNLADNNITEIKNVSLIGLGALTQLYLHGNAIQSLDKYSFMNLSNLITLDLSSQRITRLSPQTFVGLDSLRMLNLSGNQLKTIEDGTFYGLHNLLTLDISNNMIQNIGKRVFYNLPKLTHLITDKFKFCCLAKNVKSCLPMPDEFSSCGHLMDNYILRIFIWILGLIAFFGNVVVIGWRIRDMRGRKVHSILITNLALGDLMMGIYLLIVAVVDTYYRDVYIAHDEEWRHSALCKFAGFISTFSSELSVFTLTIITIDRLICIILPLRMTRLSVREATYTMLFIWLLVFFISVVPLMDIPYFQNFYGRSGVCLALHITPQRPPGWQFSVAIFLVLNFVSFLIIALSYVWMFLVARETRSAVRSIETKNDTAMARRMTLIVMTDFACWIPIIILGFVSLAGGNASNDVYAWIAVFVLPLNSAINPVLYTLSTAPFLMNFRSRVCRFRKSSMSQETNHSYVDERTNSYSERKSLNKSGESVRMKILRTSVKGHSSNQYLNDL